MIVHNKLAYNNHSYFMVKHHLKSCISYLMNYDLPTFVTYFLFFIHSLFYFKRGWEKRSVQVRTIRNRSINFNHIYIRIFFSFNSKSGEFSKIITFLTDSIVCLSLSFYALGLIWPPYLTGPFKLRWLVWGSTLYPCPRLPATFFFEEAEGDFYTACTQ